MDSFSRTKLCPSCYLTFFHIPERSIGNDWLVHQKELKLIQPPTLTKVLPKVAHAFLYIDGSFRTKLCPISYLFHFPERSIALVKRLVHKRAEIDPNLPYANKVLLPHAFLYTWMDFFQSHQTVPAVAIFLPYSRTFNCTSKTTGWFTKRAEIDPNLPHKVLT
jgi:hypothetical protein